MAKSFESWRLFWMLALTVSAAICLGPPILRFGIRLWHGVAPYLCHLRHNRFWEPRESEGPDSGFFRRFLAARDDPNFLAAVRATFEPCELASSSQDGCIHDLLCGHVLLFG